MKRSVYIYLTLLFFISALNLQAQNMPYTNQMDQAYEYAWEKNYKEALLLFDQVLEEYPDLLHAQIGKAWTLAWDQQYTQAKTIFQQVLTSEANNQEGAKGLAYIALWSGDHASAAKQFAALIKQNPQDEALIMAWGLSQLNTGNTKKARVAYQRLAGLQSPEAKALLSALQGAPGWMEVETWGGLSALAQQQKLGLRAFRLAFNPNQKLGLWLRYDGSLSLDGISNLQISNPIPAYFVGGIIRPNQKISTRLEFGIRNLPDSGISSLIMAEQAFWLRESTVLKVGGLVDFRSAPNFEHLIYGGFAQRIGQHIWIEPAYYQTIKASGQGNEQRLSVGGKYHWDSGNEIQLGGIIGSYKTPADISRASISGFWLHYQQPIFKRHWAYALIRQESNPFGQLRIGAVGIRLRLEK